MSYTIHPTISNKSDLRAGQPPKYQVFSVPRVSTVHFFLHVLTEVDMNTTLQQCSVKLPMELSTWFIPCFADGTCAKDVLVLSARIARSTRLSKPSFTSARVFEPLHAETCSIVRGSTTKLPQVQVGIHH